MYKTENQIKMILGINTWRNLLNDKLVRFTEMMPEMDKDVMMELICKLPQFWLLSKSTLDYIEKESRADISQENLAILQSTRKIVNHELECASDKPVDPKMLIDVLLQNLGSAIELDSKEREFLASLQRNGQQGIRAKAIAALTFIGAKL